MKKTFTLLAAMAVCASMHADTVKVLTLGLGTPGIDEPQLMGLGISPDGKYVCGTIENGAGYFLGSLDADQYIYDVNYDGSELRHIDNNGFAIGYFGDDGVAVSYSTGEASVLSVPSDDWKYILGEALTNDGSVLVGSLVAASWDTYGSYSRDGGEWTQLPMPSEEELGFYASKGTTAKFVSGDGKYILGSIGNNIGPAVLWILNESGEYEVDPFYLDYVAVTSEAQAAGEKPLLSLSPVNISNNGKYALCSGTLASDYSVVPVVYDTETKTVQIYDEPQEIDIYEIGMYPEAIADNGTFIGIIGQMPLMYSMGCYIWKAGEAQAESLSVVFPEYGEMFGFPESVGYVVPTAITPDGSKILGYGYYCEDFEADDAWPYMATFVIDTNEGSSVESVVTSVSVPEAIYSIDGQKLQSLKKGINIVRNADGTVKKLIKK